MPDCVNQFEMKTLALESEKMETDFMIKRLRERNALGQSTTGNIQIELANKTTSLLDLNDDCVREIFKYLNTSELCSIAEACTTTATARLLELAGDTFKGSHKIWNFDDESVTSIDELRRIFFNFGSLISGLQIDFMYLRIDAPYRKKDLLDLVIEFCSNTLESLTIEQYEITEQQMVTLRPLFNRLQKLHLKNVTTKSVAKDLFANCESLIEIDVRYSEDNMHICQNIFPKLERFTYWTSDFLDLEKFYIRHTNLETICIRSMDHWTSYMSVISDNCKQLEELDIRVTDPEVNPCESKKAVESLLGLKQLKELTIDCDYKNVTNLIRSLTPMKTLTNLSLHFVDCDSEFVPAITDLQQLRELELFSCYGLSNVNELGKMSGLTNLMISQRSSEKIDFEIVHLIKRLINLRKFMFDGDSFRMDKKTYLKIVSALQDRPIRSQHILEIGCATDDDVQIFRKYRHIVQIHRFE